jgi:hypothetical protein
LKFQQILNGWNLYSSTLQPDPLLLQEACTSTVSTSAANFHLMTCQCSRWYWNCYDIVEIKAFIPTHNSYNLTNSNCQQQSGIRVRWVDMCDSLSPNSVCGESIPFPQVEFLPAPRWIQLRCPPESTNTMPDNIVTNLEHKRKVFGNVDILYRLQKRRNHNSLRDKWTKYHSSRTCGSAHAQMRTGSTKNWTEGTEKTCKWCDEISTDQAQHRYPNGQDQMLWERRSTVLGYGWLLITAKHIGRRYGLRYNWKVEFTLPRLLEYLGSCRRSVEIEFISGNMPEGIHLEIGERGKRTCWTLHPPSRLEARGQLHEIAMIFHICNADAVLWPYAI